MEKFAQFGVEPILLLAQVVNFVILLYLLKRFFYKPVLSMIQKREEKVRVGLEAGARGEQLLVKAREEEKMILHNANQEAKTQLNEVKKSAADVEEQMRQQAKKESEEIIMRAKKHITEEEMFAAKRLEGKVVTAALRILERVLPTVLTKEDHTRILSTGSKLLKKEMS